MEFFPTHNFIVSCLGHLEKIGLLSYADLPNVQWKTPLHIHEKLRVEKGDNISVL